MTSAQTLARELPTMLLYGRPKIGKTLSVVRFGGKHLYWICTGQGALKPALDAELNPSGVVPDYEYCLDVDKPAEEVALAVDKALARIAQGQYAGIVLDDLSSFAEREYARITGREGVTEELGKARRAFSRRLLPILHRIQRAGALHIAIAHEKEPFAYNGKLTPGGPLLPGDLVTTVPALYDSVVRVGLSDGSTCLVGQRIFVCDPTDARWITGDRNNVIKTGQPLDLAAAFRKARRKAYLAAGLPVPALSEEEKAAEQAASASQATASW